MPSILEHLEESERRSSKLAVYGVLPGDCVWGEPRVKEQGHKALVLYEVDSTTFFVGKWTNYSCVIRPGPAGAVERLSDEQCEQMITNFETAKELDNITNIKTPMEKMPPFLDQMEKTLKAGAAQTKRRKQAEATAERKQKAKQKEAEEKQKQKQKQKEEKEEQERQEKQEKAGAAAKLKAAKAAADMAEAKAEAATKAEAARRAAGNGGQQATEDATAHGAGQQMKPLPPPPPPEQLPPPTSLPAGWEAAIAPSGKTYYYNVGTSERTWDCPSMKAPLPPPHVPPPESPPERAPSTSRDARWSDEQRQERIDTIRGMLPHLEGEKKASLAGELSLLLGQRFRAKRSRS